LLYAFMLMTVGDGHYGREGAIRCECDMIMRLQ
jgi:hypothetical protein